MSTKDLACAADRDVWLRTFERRLLERCVLAETATIGMVACAGGPAPPSEQGEKSIRRREWTNKSTIKPSISNI
jgi:hypothetical protein